MCPTGDAKRVTLAPPAPLVAPSREPVDDRGTTGEGASRPNSPSAARSGARPGPTRQRRRSWGGELTRWLAAGALVVVLTPPLLAGSLIAAIYWQARTDQARPVEAIVILGTAQFNGRPGAVLRARLDRALSLYEGGSAPLLVVTGGRQPGDRFTEAEAARDYLIERGVQPAAILMENEGRNTWESMRGVAALLSEQGLSRVLFVSDGFHLFRVKLMARDLGLAAFAAPASDSPIRRGSAGEFSYVLREAAAVVAYVWRSR